LGKEGQERLSATTVLICGCGALGSSVANQLVRAGIGIVKLVDFDHVQLDNLHRQFLFDESDAEQGVLKVTAAAKALAAANPTVRIEPIPLRLTLENAEKLTDGVDLLVDGTDHFRVRFLLNRIAVKRKIPLVCAGVLGSAGQILVVIPGKTPCLECLLLPDDENETEKNRMDSSGMEEHGILGPTVSLAASLQAVEAIKILTGNFDAVQYGIFSFDLWKNRWTTLPLQTLVNQETCPICGRLHDELKRVNERGFHDL